MRTESLRKHIFIFLILFWVSISGQAIAETYRISKSNTRVSFSVKHFRVFQVDGCFSDVSGSVDIAQFQLLSLKGGISTDSVETGLWIRDNNLKSELYFNSKQFPLIAFSSEVVKYRENNQFEIQGTMTIKGKRRPILFSGSSWKSADEGEVVLLLKAVGTINRQDFGIGPREYVGEEGLVVGNKVRFEIFAEICLQPEGSSAKCKALHSDQFETCSH